MITQRLTERLDIYHSIVSADTIYHVEKVFWKFIKTVFADKENERGSTSFPLPGNVYSTTISFLLRYNTSIRKKGTRIVYNGENYRIVEVVHIQRNQFTKITLEAEQ